jgi:hypothetical protein
VTELRCKYNPPEMHLASQGELSSTASPHMELTVDSAKPVPPGVAYRCPHHTRTRLQIHHVVAISEIKYGSSVIICDLFLSLRAYRLAGADWELAALG